MEKPLTCGITINIINLKCNTCRPWVFPLFRGKKGGGWGICTLGGCCEHPLPVLSWVRSTNSANPPCFQNYHALYRKEIGLLIEDPLPKDSKQSHYIQISDLISYIVYLYTINHLKIGGFSNRLQKIIDIDIVTKWMKCLSPVFNLKASRSNEYGVVYYPK